MVHELYEAIFLVSARETQQLQQLPKGLVPKVIKFLAFMWCCFVGDQRTEAVSGCGTPTPVEQIRAEETRMMEAICKTMSNEATVTISSGGNTTMLSTSRAIPQATRDSQGNPSVRQESTGTTHGITDILGKQGLCAEETQQQEEGSAPVTSSKHMTIDGRVIISA